MSSNNVVHLITSTIITLQHFATLHQTTLHYTYRETLWNQNEATHRIDKMYEVCLNSNDTGAINIFY